MNIFILDLDHELNSIFHVDRHVNKMILESAQMLSTAVRLSGIDAGYKVTHINHPCNKWTRRSLSNWRWLKGLTKCLNEECQYRGKHKRNHKSFELIMSLPEPCINDIGLTPFEICMDDSYKIPNDVVGSYRSYYKFGKSHLHSWRGRSIPPWI